MLILRDCMSSSVISVAENATVQEAAQVMAAKGISSIFVQDPKDYAGMIIVIAVTTLMSPFAMKGLCSRFNDHMLPSNST